MVVRDLTHCTLCVRVCVHRGSVSHLESQVILDVDGDERLDPLHLAPKGFDVADEQGELPLGVCQE